MSDHPVLAPPAAPPISPHRAHRAHRPEVTLVRWPSEADARVAARDAGHACLLLIEHGQRPPDDWTELEDWLRLPADPRELSARRQALATRLARQAPAWIDDDGLLRRLDRWVALSPIEGLALAALLERPGSLVTKAALLGAVHDDEPPASETRALDHSMQRLRRRVQPLGLALHTVRGMGYVLELGEVPA